jgi:hypothetical protein
VAQSTGKQTCAKNECAADRRIFHVGGALLDANLTTGLIHNKFNSAMPGRYVFQFRNGVPLAHP